MKAADTAQAAAAAARGKLAPAREVLTTVEAAQRDVAEQLRREGQQTLVQQLADTVDATRDQLRGTLDEALAALRTAQVKFREAQRGEGSFALLARDLHNEREKLSPANVIDGLVHHSQFYPERPFATILESDAGATIRTLVYGADVPQAVE